MRILCALLFLVAPSGCGAAIQTANDDSQTSLRKRASFDMGCPADQLEFEPLESYSNGYVTTWGVTGCGSKATYLKASSGQWVMNGGDTQSSKSASEASP